VPRATARALLEELVMRRWFLILVAALVSALLVVLHLRAGRQPEAAPATAAVTAAISAPASPRSAPTAPPALPAAAAAPATGNPDLDARVKAVAADSEAQLDQKIAAIDDEIATRTLVERANAGTLTAAEQAGLGALLRQRNALQIARSQRIIAELDALDTGGEPAAATP
jgi:hypothetical protein